jgi:hypothetical protein
MQRKLLIAGSLAALCAVTGCTAPTGDATNSATRTAAPEPTASQTPTASPSAAPTTPPGPRREADAVVGTIVRFTSDDAVVDVTITADNPTTRDLLSTLPLTLSVEEFAGREKISYLPRELETAGSPGWDPANGDLIYYVPWGNLGFFYNAAGGYSDDVIQIGTFSATLEQLTGLEGGGVTVEALE